MNKESEAITANVSEECECGGSGLHTDADPIERCGLCAVFESDEAARNAARLVCDNCGHLITVGVDGEGNYDEGYSCWECGSCMYPREGCKLKWVVV